MIYLFDKDEKLIKIVKKEAIKTALQKFALTTEKYVSDRLTVEMKELSKKEFDAVEYMAIQSIEDAHTFHYFYIAQKFSENLTTLIGVQSGIEELRKSVVLDKRPHNTFARPIINELLAGTNWQARFVSETSQRSTNFYYISTFEALKKVCQVWNLEMQFFVEVNGNKIGARYIDFKEKIGEATGKRVVYGHNALQILQEVERTNLFTALIGRGKGEELSAPSEESSHGTYGRRITFEDVVWETKKGNPVDKPKGQKYVELPEMTKRYGIKNADGTMRAKVGFAVFEDEEDKNVLIKRTYDELVNASRPQLTLKTSTVYLKGVKIGDTIRVVRHDKKLDYDTRIFEITFNRLNNESSDIKLGDRISESNEAKIQNIASQKVDELVSSGFNNIISKLPEFLPSPDGFNNNWYGKDDPTKKYVGKVLVNDIWFKPDPEHEGQTILLRWTGEVWQEIIRSNSKQEIIDEIERQFGNLDKSALEEVKRRSEEALKKAGASEDLAKQAKQIADENVRNLNTFKATAERAQTQLSQDVNNFKNEYGSKMLEVTQTTDGIKTKIGEITSFIDKDGQRQEELKRYAREETAKQTSVIRETLSQDFVAKSTYLENVEGTKQRFEALTRENETKFAEYKQGIDGRIIDIASQIAGKVNEVDFQRVKETSQLYERVLGNTEQGLPDKISRLVMSNEIFQTEVNDLVVSDNNLIVNSEKLDKHTIVAKRDGVSIYNTSYGVFNIDAQGLTGYNWGGFTLPIYVPKILKGEVYTLGFKYKIRRQLDHEFCVVIKNHSQNKTVLQKTIANPETPVRNVWIDFQGTFKMTEDLDFDQQGNFPIFFYLVKNGWVEVKEPMLVRGPRTGSFKPSQFDEAYRNLEATKTQVTQLAGSWSVKNLNSAGDVLGAINLNPDGSVKINEGLISVGEKTYIKDGVIKKSMIGNAQIGTAHIGEIDASKANIINISAKNVVMDSAMANKMVSSDLFTDALVAKTAFINKLRSSVVTADLLEGFKGRIGGFQIGTHEKDPNTYWLTGINQFAVGMSNGSSAWGQVALWVNWGTDWGKSGPYAWYVLRTGEMYCKNDAGFYKKVDFADGGSVNFYGSINYYKEPKFFKGLNMWDSEIIGGGSNPKGGNNAVVWWNQIGSGSVKYWIDKSSDRRLKENIAPTTVNAIDTINKLDMVEFDFIKDKKHEEVGLIAQEVEKVIPQAISRDPESEDSYLHIDYTAFVPYLIKAIQELNQKLEEANERRN
jgi:phage minor structural protein, N-terminal domain protein